MMPRNRVAVSPGRGMGSTEMRTRSWSRRVMAHTKAADVAKTEKGEGGKPCKPDDEK